MFQFKGTIIRPNMKTQSWYIQRVHTLWDPYCLQRTYYVHTVLLHSESAHTVGSILFTVHTLCAHSPATFRECTHCGIHIVYSAQYWYIQRVHTLCALSECTSTVFSYLAWWRFLWTETCRQIFNIACNVYYFVIDWNKLLCHLIKKWVK